MHTFAKYANNAAIAYSYKPACLNYGKVMVRIRVEIYRHDYTIGTLEVLHACDACVDMGMTYSVIVQCTDCVVFPIYQLCRLTNRMQHRYNQ